MENCNKIMHTEFFLVKKGLGRSRRQVKSVNRLSLYFDQTQKSLYSKKVT